ncbi:uncharacterized protein [Antedon mediterranea]|uniref:uncharacterized protein isoform X1 n=1 Tax=Antedon mediterranea TaxID=105859 RepID=UPI003AF95615
MESSEQSNDSSQVLGISGDYALATAAAGIYQNAEAVTGNNGDDTISVHTLDEETTEKQYPPLREQDRFLPIANVARIMKTSIPPNGKISKEAKECVQECVSEFISFITSEASERCHQEKRKTINGEDILFAMSNLGFDNYVEPLKVYLQKYRDSVKGEKSSGMTAAEQPIMEEMSEEFNTTNLIGTDQTGQQSAMYTYTNQINF